MNALRLLLKFSLLFIVVFIVTYHHGCKDPDDYIPGNDSLVPPPPAPHLLYPRDDTVMWYWQPYPNQVELGWSIIDDAQYYELELAHDSAFTAMVGEYRAYTYSYTYSVTHDGVYYWRVRAYNEHWTWYTDWSETWTFYAWFRP
jgi:hypothetical protein